MSGGQSTATASGRTLSQEIAAFAVATIAEGSPEIVRTNVQQRVLDVLGLQLAAVDLATSRQAIEFVRAQGGNPQASFVGSPEKVPAAWAAFINGVLAHSLDFDDTHLPSILHPSATVVPAALAAAEVAGVSGAQFLDAVAVGIECVVRLGMAGFDKQSNNSVFFEHGQHATSICGAVGSAVSASLLLGGEEGKVVNSVGVAASMAGGIIEANRTGGTVKRLHCGWAAHAGVSAALLVEYGFTGPPTALEGRFGFFEAFLHGTVDLKAVTRELGSSWEVPGVFFKPYPANHFTHTGLDAARRVAQSGVHADDVEEIVLGVASPTVRTIGEPLEFKQRPQTGYQAQFSGPYMVALGFLGGEGLGATLDDFHDELVRDPRRLELMSRVRVEGDSECDAIYPYQFPSVLRVRTRDGSEVIERVLVNRGGSERPLTREEIELKFRANAARTIDQDEIEACVARVRALPSASTVDLALTRTVPQGGTALRQA